MGAYLPKIGITMGDPAGIGPEIIIKALADYKNRDKFTPIVLGDAGILEETASELGIPSPLNAISSPEEAKSKSLNVISLSSLGDIKKGEMSAAAGHASGTYIEKGVDLALSGLLDAIVTAPICKESFNEGGFPYPGHTEFLAELTGTSDYAMMLMGESLKVVLLTIHCPLMKVAGLLSPEETLRIIRLADRSLKKYFNLEKPALALASLNPHAGEGGLFGEEEERLLLPASRAARSEGIDVTDPLPADTLFFFAAKGKYDAVICPYHDQALIPLKLLHFEEGVNVTLGLPIIRTSPDHGTAFDIAGKGIANPESMKSAVSAAFKMSLQKRNVKGAANGE